MVRDTKRCGNETGDNTDKLTQGPTFHQRNDFQTDFG